MNPLTPGAALAAALLTPHDNYGARSAARDQQLQLQGILTAQEQQRALEAQQSQAAVEQQLAAERALPFLGKDVAKLAAEVKKHENSVYERIRDGYKGDVAKWFASEGLNWQADTARQLTQSPIYQQGAINRRNVLAAQAAMQQGQHLVGTPTVDGYRIGEQDLQDFLAGKTDSYNHRGSYAPADDLKELRGQNAPGKLPWERMAISEPEKLAHLIDLYGEEVGTSKYYRQHANVPVFYKTESIDKGIKFSQDNARFGMEQGRFAMAKDDQRMQHELHGLQVQGLKLSNQKKQNELSGGQNGSVPFDHYLLSSPSELIQLRHDPVNPKQLSNGVDLGKVKSLAGVTLYGNGDDILARSLGLQRNHDGYYNGRFDSAFTTENGVHAINLKGVKHDIVGLSSKVYYSPADLGPNADHRTPLQGYARVTLKFSPYEAEKAGLYDPNRLPLVDKNKPTSVFDSETRLGVGGVYDPASGTATVYVPAGDLRNVNFQKALQKDEKGTKSANEDFNAPQLPYMDTSFDVPYIPRPIH